MWPEPKFAARGPAILQLFPLMSAVSLSTALTLLMLRLVRRLGGTKPSFCTFASPTVHRHSFSARNVYRRPLYEARMPAREPLPSLHQDLAASRCWILLPAAGSTHPNPGVPGRPRGNACRNLTLSNPSGFHSPSLVSFVVGSAFYVARGSWDALLPAEKLDWATWKPRSATEWLSPTLGCSFSLLGRGRSRERVP